MLKLTDKIINEIYDRLSQGETLPSICKSDGMPHYCTVIRWLKKNDKKCLKFKKAYIQAKRNQADFEADEIKEIADEKPLSEMERFFKKTFFEFYPPESKEDAMAFDALCKYTIQYRRIRIDVRKWRAAKNRPTKYGDASLRRKSPLNDKKDNVKKEFEQVDLRYATDEQLTEYENLNSQVAAQQAAARSRESAKKV